MPSITNLVMPFFDQWMLPGSDPRTCVIEAICVQLADLELAPPGYPHPWLWRQVNKKGELTAEPLSADNVWRRVSRFCTRVLGRTVQMRDVARRAAVSKVQQCKAVSSEDLAKIMHVRPDTIGVYHSVKEKHRMRVAAAMAVVHTASGGVTSAAHLPPVQSVGQYNDCVQHPLPQRTPQSTLGTR